jgi:hypothetical protein
MDRAIIVSYKGLKRQRLKGPKDTAADAKNFEPLWLCDFQPLLHYPQKKTSDINTNMPDVITNQSLRIKIFISLNKKQHLLHKA